MSREITFTKSRFANQELPDGRTAFRVLSVDKKYGKKNNAEFFVWKLQHDKGEGEQLLMPNMMGGLLRVLKCTEVEPDKFDWDTFDQINKVFLATVSHKPDEQNSSVIRQHMGEFAPVDENDIPF